MAAFDLDKPEQGSLSIRLPDAPGGAVELRTFLSYHYNEHYLSGCDSGCFQLDGSQISDKDKAALVPRTRCNVYIDGQLQSSGIISGIECKVSRNGGSVVEINTKDWLSPAVDSQIDPGSRFNPDMFLSDVMEEVYIPFGAKQFIVDNEENRNAITGGIHAGKSSKKGRPLKSYKLHELKPYPNEGAHAFASRVAQRFGLWIRPAADGQTVVVAKPDFEQSPRYQLRLNKGTDAINNNVLDANIRTDFDDQPSIILASGFGGGGEFAKAQLKMGIINPLISNADELTKPILKKYPGLTFAEIDSTLAAALKSATDIRLPDICARPIFLEDTNSHTLQELEAYLRRELSIRMRKSMTAKYRIMGHRVGGNAVALDTIFEVRDSKSFPSINTNMWVLGRDFVKGREGTTTTIELIRPGTLIF